MDYLEASKKYYAGYVIPQCTEKKHKNKGRVCLDEESVVIQFVGRASTKALWKDGFTADSETWKKGSVAGAHRTWTVVAKHR